jgi:hypothetical protein
MTAYVDECRHEWKRLGVPDLLAEEMATELESDLAEAQADGVSAAEMLGESDPRRFAATWASERGLVPEQPQPARRRRWWVWALVALFVLFFVLAPVAWIGLQTVSVSTSHAQPPTRVHAVVLPSFAGLNACQAVHKALRAGYTVRVHPRAYSCNAVIHAENETAKGSHRMVTLWLRRARR